MSLVDSPFVNRLHTNSVPSDSEVLEIRSLLVDPANELARIDAQIEAMEIALNQLKQQRASLREPIDAHLALISPMRRIPQDVLLEIFFCCLPTEHNALMDPAEAPLLLGRICWPWRGITYSTPMLWSSIHIPCPSYSFTPPSILFGFGRIIEAWLGRSNPCPLSVSVFDDQNFAGNPPHHQEHPLIIQLIPVFPRLRQLELTGDAELFRPLLQLGPQDLPLLKRISISSEDDRPGCTNVFQSPTLEDVALSIFTPVDPLSFPFRWTQLTKLSLECFSVWGVGVREGGLDPRGAFDVLRMCFNLVQCKIRITKGTGLDLDLDMPSLILPNMETLIWAGGSFPRWISHPVVPNLRFLAVGDASSKDKPSGMPRDRSLSADIEPNQWSKSGGLRDFLRSFPTISHLRLSGSVHLDGLEIFGSPDGLCPELTHFTMLSASTEVSDAETLALVKARMTMMPTILRQIHIRFDRPKEVDIMPELQSFIADGLQVTLEYASPSLKFDAREGLHRV
ncbi:hypothetical protein C8R45DRAFT_967070 [Mycena sanguinolenta]|nr:hypothetical protein C8R45DRAFT_967070 [Mycena sanguinolenta]